MRIGVIGGGAAGMMAAIAASEQGAAVTVIEKNARIGKKILATGNGKCNFTNISVSNNDYYSQDNNIYDDYISQFDQYQVISFFQKYGMMYKNKNGYCYPRCEQASVILDVLRNALAFGKVEIQTQLLPSQIEKRDGFYQVHVGMKKPMVFDKLILACGSPAGQKEFCKPSGYTYAKNFGHSLIPLRCGLVSLKCSDQGFSSIAGVRCDAGIHLYEDGRLLAEERGELQLTDYGISGIPVFQISRHVKPGRHSAGRFTAMLDFLPEYSEEEWEILFRERWEAHTLAVKTQQEIKLEDFFLGVLHKKLNLWFLRRWGLKPETSLCSCPVETIRSIWKSMKHCKIEITETNSFEYAQVCAGGIPLNEITLRMESKISKGLFFAGEMLDVDGRCGGYNLQWAWTSGYLAGHYAAEACSKKEEKA